MRKAFLAILYNGIMRSFLRVIVGVKYVNKESVKQYGQFILVSNHNSHLDTMALMSALSPGQLVKTHPVAAGDYFGKSPFRSFVTKLFINAVLIKRNKAAEGPDPIELMSQNLKNGHSLILFPEGSRGEPEIMQQFKKGIGVLLEKHPDIPYIPVYMKGMGKILPKGEKLLVPFNSFVIFGTPTFCKNKKVEEIVSEIEHTITNLSIQFQEQTGIK